MLFFATFNYPFRFARLNIVNCIACYFSFPTSLFYICQMWPVHLTTHKSFNFEQLQMGDWVTLLGYTSPIHLYTHTWSLHWLIFNLFGGQMAWCSNETCLRGIESTPDLFG